jgi:hypothetical protein
MFETLVLEDPRIRVILKMAIVDPKSDEVEASVLEGLGIYLGEIVFEELQFVRSARGQRTCFRQAEGRLTLSKKSSYFSLPRALSIPARSWSRRDSVLDSTRTMHPEDAAVTHARDRESQS